MNHLKIKTSLEHDYYYLDIILDGVSLTGEGGVIDPFIIFSSFREGLSDYLVSCSCGEPGCAGIYSEFGIIHHEKYVIFVIPKPIFYSTVKELPDDISMDIYYIDYSNFRAEILKAANHYLECFNLNKFLKAGYYGQDMEKLLNVCHQIENKNTHKANQEG